MGLISYIKKVIISKIKFAIKSFLFVGKYGFAPSSLAFDMSGYELIMDEILKSKIYQLEGDFVEIGAFLGGGTYKIAKLLEQLRVSKKLFVIDIFNFEFDKTPCTQGKSMAEIYKGILKGRNQYQIYSETIKNCKNVVTICKDSKEVKLPCEKVAFAYIDGNHSAEYVKSDFYLIWDKLVPNGIIVFDDYGFDLPVVTKTVHQIIGEQNDKVNKIWTAGFKTMFIQKK